MDGWTVAGKIGENLISCAATHIAFGFIPGAYEAIDLAGNVLADYIPLDFVGHADAHAGHAHETLTHSFDTAAHGAECASHMGQNVGIENACVHNADISGLDTSGDFDDLLDQALEGADEFGELNIGDSLLGGDPQVMPPSLTR